MKDKSSKNFIYTLNYRDDVISDVISAIKMKSDNGDVHARHLILDWFSIHSDSDDQLVLECKCPPVQQRKSKICEEYPQIFTKVEIPEGEDFKVIPKITNDGYIEMVITRSEWESAPRMTLNPKEYLKKKS